jgi:chemotaxis protein methyltransferase CheR
MMDVVLPEWYGKNRGKTISIWSSACSTGEEPYTMAIECSRFKEAHSDFDFRILATDISGTVLEKAHKGIYLEEKVSPVPDALMRKYFTRSRDRSKRVVRAKVELRNKISFLRLNLMDPSFPFRDRFDVVFCRNVLIYFDREHQLSLLRNIARSMHEEGFLFLGHSETLTGIDVPFRSVAATVYRKKQGEK